MWITNLISLCFGWAAAIRLPVVLRQPLIRFYAWCFKADLSLCSQPLAEYQSLQQFFVRNLKDGCRSIGRGLLSPVDGKLRSFGDIENGQLEQVKGKDYQLKEFLQNDQYLSLFRDGQYFNLYLAPGDYHHVHMPVEGEIIACSYIPGVLLPVNDWSLRRVRGLFVRNERLVIYVKSELGLMALVMVGATNVGCMTISFDCWRTNFKPWQRIFNTLAPEHRNYSKAIHIQAGDRLGTFHLGSTVVLLLQAGAVDLTRIKFSNLPSKIKYGETLVEA